MPLSDWVAARAGLSLCWGYHATIRLGSSQGWSDLCLGYHATIRLGSGPGWSESLLGLSCHFVGFVIAEEEIFNPKIADIEDLTGVLLFY